MTFVCLIKNKTDRLSIIKYPKKKESRTYHDLILFIENDEKIFFS
jgi:hypothetical protein